MCNFIRFRQNVCRRRQNIYIVGAPIYTHLHTYVYTYLFESKQVTDVTITKDLVCIVYSFVITTYKCHNKLYQPIIYMYSTCQKTSTKVPLMVTVLPLGTVWSTVESTRKYHWVPSQVPLSTSEVPYGTPEVLLGTSVLNTYIKIPLKHGWSKLMHIHGLWTLEMPDVAHLAPTYSYVSSSVSSLIHQTSCKSTRTRQGWAMVEHKCSSLCCSCAPPPRPTCMRNMLRVYSMCDLAL